MAEVVTQPNEAARQAEQHRSQGPAKQAEQQRQQRDIAAKLLADQRKQLEKSHEEYAMRMKGKPTPTQEENDLAALGAHFDEHEPDGSDLDPFAQPTPVVSRHMEAKPGAGAPYQTRQAKPTT
jgi:hypothetical protein